MLVFLQSFGINPPAWLEGWGDEVGWIAAAFAVVVLLWYVERRRNLAAQALLESWGEGVYGLDTRGRIGFANPAALKALGYMRAELLGRKQEELFPGVAAVQESHLAEPNLIEAALRDGQARSGEHVFMRRDGSCFPVHVSVTPVLRRRRVHGAVVAFSDISERKRTEAALETLNERLVALIEAIPDAIFFKDGDGRWLITNQTAKKLFKLDEIDWQGKTELELAVAHPEFRHAHEACLIDDERAWQAGGLMLFAERVTGEGGELHDFEVRKVPIFGPGHVRKGLVIIGRDVSEYKRAEEDLRIAATAFESEEGMIVTDASNRILRVNRAFTEITGYTAAEAIDDTPRMLRSGRHDAAFYRNLWTALAERGFWRGEIWNRRKNGEIFPEWVSITAVRNEGRVTHYVAAFSDISEQKKAEAQILNLAYYDPLTGLANRRLLMDRIQHALAASRRSRRWSALLLLDLDYFKTLNDTRGHAVGDALLVQVGRRIRDNVREEDSVARLGGDEFVVLCEDLSEDEAVAAAQAELVANNIRAKLAAPFALDDDGRYEHCATTSIGVTLFRDQVLSVEDVMKQADLALYQSKDAGRNTTRFFSTAMQAAVDTRARTEAALRRALAQGEFVLYYQPQVDAQGRIFGVEALIRWQHPEFGLVSPNDFIPLAEETGLIVSIGAWVLGAGCRQIKDWSAHPAAAGLQLSVNVSARQLLRTDFVGQVSDCLRTYGLEGSRLKIELTESIFLDNLAEAIGKMRALRNLGVSFSLDDFGKGYSSLMYLKRLPIDQIKIDQSFVHDAPASLNDAAIVRAIIAMGQALNLHVIAEGVETEAQYDFLLANGCPAFQGFRYGQPLPAAKLDAEIANGYVVRARAGGMRHGEAAIAPPSV